MATTLTGRCVCARLHYSAKLASTDDARTSLCHCSSCKRAFGTNYGLTTKVPLEGFSYTRGQPKKFKQDNGVIREFCDTCGAFVCEYGEAAADKFRYVMWGTFDEPDKVPPKGEFFCAQREGWMPEIDGVFHKQEIKQ
ncbi:hypothetical protein GCG54_00005121 [Colletotrichum gloeosporioides]|uniref:CENP-V/GFA domain-containing protein n=1 Tax=Colletotrichum gloeosporioides TaxID=474922 RepID=A0A8H4FKR6_COLGL|nr:uncharacterized protein GCG54_00005121 [Colletotrichum gloeosporioides]KAF3805757.1 hypothetical protein GCG54_00005121 [Colletotrichum gloeosporioides]